MKKYILSVFFLLCFSLAQGQEVEDYKIFIKGKKYLQAGNYSNAKLEFEFLIRNYPNSLVFSTKYANYYIGMTYYRLQDYSKARKYLETAIYMPNEFHQKTGYFKNPKNNYFEYRRNYYLAQLFFDLNDDEKGTEYLKLLIKDYYTPELAIYEAKALQQLSKYDSYYSVLYKIKYKNNISLIPTIKNKDLIPVGDFFVSKGLYDNAANAYSFSLKSNPNFDVNIKLLIALTRGKRYEDVSRITSNLLKSNDNSDYYYFRGNAIRRMGNVPGAIRDFRRVSDGKYKLEAQYSIARLLYLKKEYSLAIKIAKTIDTKEAHTLLIDSYIKNNQQKDFTHEAINYIKKYPYSDEAGYYRFLLYKTSKNEDYLKWIKKYNFNTYYYELANSIDKSSYTRLLYPIGDKLIEYKKTILKLEELTKLGDSEILRMNFERLDFPEKDKVFEKYLISMIYEEGGFYHLAIKNSISNRRSFVTYANLLDILYPRYYSNLVEASCKTYDVEPAIIYAIIMKESLFNRNIISKSAAYGLMQLIIPTAMDMNREISPEKLLDPSVNIDLGTRYVKILLNKYNGDVTKVAAAYNGGMGNVDRWSKGGKLDIESIPLPETREYTKDVLSNYYKYKRLYSN